MHLADAFITSDLYCIGDIHFDRLSIPHAWRAIAAIYCLSYKNAVRINTLASRNNFSFVYYWVFRAQSLDWLCLQLYALHSSLPSESLFKSCWCYWFPSLSFFLFLCFSFTFFFFTFSVCFHLSSQFLFPLVAALRSELFFDSSVEEDLSSDGELQAIMREFDQMFSSGVSPAPLDPQANPNSSKTCSLKITMPLILAAFDSSDW